MELRKGAALFSLSVGLVTFGGCEYTKAPVVDEMAVDCESSPDDVFVLSLNALKIAPGTEGVVAITDQLETQTVKIRLLGGLAINGRNIDFNDAGEILETLPNATLIAGIPLLDDEGFYAGDEGLTLMCNDADLG